MGKAIILFIIQLLSFVLGRDNWNQQGPKLVGTGYVGWPTFPINQGNTIAIDTYGELVVVGGWKDNNGVGATWIFKRDQASGNWTQSGTKLVGNDGVVPTHQGVVDVSEDGTYIAVGGYTHAQNTGATWIWVNTGGSWSEQQRLIGTGATGPASQGWSVSINGAGDTVAVGGFEDNKNIGATWVFFFDLVQAGRNREINCSPTMRFLG